LCCSLPLRVLPDTLRLMVPSSAKSAACTGMHVEEHAAQFQCCCRMAAQVFK